MGRQVKEIEEKNWGFEGWIYRRSSVVRGGGISMVGRIWVLNSPLNYMGSKEA